MRLPQDAGRRAALHHPRMGRRTTYAISWREDEGPRHVGSLELDDGLIRLAGRMERAFGYGDVLDIASRRTSGRRVVALLLAGGRQLVITSLDRVGSLGELERELRTRVGLA